MSSFLVLALVMAALAGAVAASSVEAGSFASAAFCHRNPGHWKCAASTPTAMPTATPTATPTPPSGTGCVQPFIITFGGVDSPDYGPAFMNALNVGASWVRGVTGETYQLCAGVVYVPSTSRSAYDTDAWNQAQRDLNAADWWTWTPYRVDVIFVEGLPGPVPQTGGAAFYDGLSGLVVAPGDALVQWTTTAPGDPDDWDDATGLMLHEMFHAFSANAHESCDGNNIEDSGVYSWPDATICPVNQDKFRRGVFSVATAPPPPSPTATATATATPTVPPPPPPSVTSTATPTQTPVPPTATATAVPTATATPPSGTYTASPCLDITNQSNRVIEWLRIGPCPGDHGIHIYNSSNITIRNVIIEGAITGIATLDSDGIHVDGNVTIINPYGPIPEGQCVQFDKQAGGTIRGVTCRAGGAGTKPEDLLAAYQSTDILIEGNDAQGGTSRSGCGIIVDGSGARITIRNNIVADMVNCGIGVATGTDILVENNQLIDRNGNGQACDPSVGWQGGSIVDNSCLYVWNQYPSPCNNIRILNNFVVDNRPYWNGGGCTNVTVSGNSW